MKKVIFYLMLCFWFISIALNAQEHVTSPIQSDVISAGLGFGKDYGGTGVHIIVYPHRNIGIFGGLGGKFDGLEYNVGLKIRHLSKNPTAKVFPYAIVMYGYNEALVVRSMLSLEYNKVFYGPTVGIGIDLKFQPRSKFYYSFGLNVPIRGSQVNDYIDDLRTNWGIDASNDLRLVTISIGVKYIVLRK